MGVSHYHTIMNINTGIKGHDDEKDIGHIYNIPENEIDKFLLYVREYWTRYEWREYILEYINNKEDRDSRILSSDISSYTRKIIHEVAEEVGGVIHTSVGEDHSDRHIVLSKASTYRNSTKGNNQVHLNKKRRRLNK